MQAMDGLYGKFYKLMHHRLATEEDFDFIYEVYMHPDSNPYLTYDHMPETDFRKIFQHLLATNSLYVTLENSNRIGTYRLISKENRQAHCVYLGSFGLASSMKGKGYGFKILQGIKEIVKQNGQSRIELTVDVDNQAAIHLYKKAGFEIEGTVRDSYKLNTTGQFYDEYLMAILL
jgi:putative acetyltransferase